MQSILQIVQNAELELGLPVSTSVYGTNGQPTDATGTQLGALANRVLDELRRTNRWTALQFEYNLVVNPPIMTTGTLIAESPVITNIPSTAGLSAWSWAVASPAGAIPVAARILSVDSPTQITMTMENSATETVDDVEVQFAQDTYPMPVGFDFYNNRTMWDRTNRWELLGPDSPQMDQWHRSGIVVTGPRRHFRQISPFPDQFRIWPAPYELVEPLQLVFEYLSIAAVNVQNQSNTYSQYFTNDTDTPLLDDQAMIMGLKWMFWEIKGFGSYATLQSRWVDYVKRLAARDGGAPTLQVTKRQNPIFVSPANVQDGFFPGPVGPNMS